MALNFTNLLENIMNITPHNDVAHRLLARAKASIDGRLRLDEEEVDQVICFALAHSHRPFQLIGHRKVVDALLGEVLGREAGKTTFFLKPEYHDGEAWWATDEEPGFGPYPRTKGGLWARTRASARSITWSDVAGLGYGPAYFIAPVDFAATYAAFSDGAAPSVSFQSCDYHRQDEKGAAAFAELVEKAAFARGVGLVQIGDGWVCSDPSQALMHWHIETTRHFNRHGPRFAFLTRDRYDREAISWGSYQG